MKKIIIIVLGILLFTGCDDVMNTPTKRVEEFLGKYQTMDSEVINDLESVLDDNPYLNDESKKEYEKALKRQYQNLSYKVKDEIFNGSNATVEVEIEVYNYKKVNDDGDSYVLEQQDEFLNEDGTLNEEKATAYKIEQMNKTSEKVKYTITFSCTKEGNTWKLDPITETTRQKIHGLY